MENNLILLKNCVFENKYAKIDAFSFVLKSKMCVAFSAANAKERELLCKGVFGYAPLCGRGIVLNKDIYDPFLTRRHLMGYAPNEMYIYKNMKISKLIKLNDRFYTVDTIQNALELLDYFELDENQKVKSLNQNDLALLKLILAISHDPAVLIIDNLIAYLNPESLEKFASLLKKLKDKGVGILYTGVTSVGIMPIVDCSYSIQNSKVLNISEKLENKL